MTRTLPPPGAVPRLRWEWTPEQVPVSELFPYYDYVLTRGTGFTPPPGTFHSVWRGGRWTVWQLHVPGKDPERLGERGINALRKVAFIARDRAAALRRRRAVTPSELRRRSPTPVFSEFRIILLRLFRHGCCLIER